METKQTAEVNQNGCQEAAAGHANEYVPCGRDVVAMVDWPPRDEPAIRVCAACLDHNVRNRGGRRLPLPEFLPAVREWSAEMARTPAIVEQAEAVVICDDESFRDAAGLLDNIKGLRDELHKKGDKNISLAFRLHRGLVAELREAEAPLVAAEAIVKERLAGWQQAQEQARAIAQRKADEAARAEEEKRRIEAAAELEKLAVATGDESLREEAHALVEAPAAPVFAAPVAPATPKVEGLSFRENWSFEVVDLGKLVRHVADHPEFTALLSPNDAGIRALVRSLKGATVLPGVRVFSEKVVASRRR